MIRYSGYPVYYQEFAFDVSPALSNIVTMLVNAGWNIVRQETVVADSYSVVAGGPGYVLASRRTPQGLQCRLKVWQDTTSNYIWFRFYDVGETKSNVSPSFLVPRTGSLLRIIANPYQFFTFKYNDTTETGNVMMGGVPWLPSLVAPFVILSAVNSTGSTVDVVLNGAHGYTGELVNVDGATGCTGLNGTFNATAVNTTTLRLQGCQISGTYTASSGVLAGPDRIAKLIWSQASAYAVSGLFHAAAKTFRNMLSSTPSGVIGIGDKRANNAQILNQYGWVIANDVSYQNLPGAVQMFHMVPYQLKWYDGSYFAHEPFLISGETSTTAEARVCAQLWDSIAVNNNFGQLDKTIQFDGFSWLIYTSMIGVTDFTFHADGALLLKISN